MRADGSIDSVFAAAGNRWCGALREAEVQQLGARLRQHDIRRLQIAMDDARAVGLVERVADVDRVAQGVGRRQRTAGQLLGERLAFEILEHEKTNRVISERRSVGVRSVADVIERADVWVIERRDGARLPLEALASLRARGEGGVEHFDRDGSVKPRIAGAIDLGHPSRADEREDFIRAKPHPVCQGHGGASSCVSVGPNGEDTWNVRRTDPMRMVSPSASAMGDVTRSPPRNVPFLLPQSSRTAASDVTTTRA